MRNRRTIAAAVAAAIPALLFSTAAGETDCSGETVVEGTHEGEIEIPGSPGLGEGLSESTVKEIVVDFEGNDGSAVITVDWENAHNDHDLYVYDEEGEEYVGGRFNFVGGDQFDGTNILIGEYGDSYETATVPVADDCETLRLEFKNFDAFDPEATAKLTVELGDPIRE